MKLEVKVFILFFHSKIVRVVCAVKICFGMFIKPEGKGFSILFLGID